MGKLKDLEIQGWIRAGKPIAGKSDGNGLTFTLSPKGAASWVFRYRFGGKQREMTIGSYPTVGLKRARELAHEARVKVQQGADVARLKQEELALRASAGTVKELCEEYYKREILGAVDPIRRPDLIRAQLDNDLIKSMGRVRIADVKPQDVDKMLLAIIDRGSKIMANRVLTTTKAVFDFAVRRNWIEYNPAAAYRRKDAGGEEKPRQRSLSDTDIAKLFQGFEKAGPVFRVYDLATRLLLLTAVRKSELIEAAWIEFDLDSGVWTLPKERIKTGDKSGKDFTIPLPPLAVEWLREIQQVTIATSHVFPARRRTGKKTLSPETLNWAVGEVEHGIEHFTLHDLRRTARTQLAALGIKPHIAERCLNHRLPGINDIYDTYDYLDERRAALELWATKLEKLLKGEPFNVVPLRKGEAA